MGQIRFQPWKTVTDLFKKAPQTQANYDPYAAAPSALPAALPTSYQVKQGDTFGSIAQQYGLSESQLQDNNKMLVVPPKGSYISVNPQTGANSFYSGQKVNTGAKSTRVTSKSLVNQGVPATVASPFAGAPVISQMGVNSFSSGAGKVNLVELQNHINQQLANGQTPTTIPFGIKVVDPVTGQVQTDADMRANGYNYNNIRQQWEQTGAATGGAATGGAAAGTDDAPDPYSEVKSVYWSKSKGYVTPEVAALKAKKRRQRQNNRPAAVVPNEATNAGATPVTTLDVRVGSG